MPEIQCARCGQSAPQLERVPLRSELGERIRERICLRCWDEWLRYQTALINHYGLDVREKSAREFLTANMESFLFKPTAADEHASPSPAGTPPQSQ